MPGAPPFPATRDFPSRGNESVTGLAFCIIWYDKHSANWLAALASPYPAAPDFSTGKRVTRFSGRFAPLRIVFPCHPYAGGRIKHLEASLRKRLCSKHGLLCPRLRGKGGGASHQRGIAFPTPAGRLYGFIQTGAFYNLEAPPQPSAAKPLSNLRTFGAIAPSNFRTLTPIRACP